MSVTPVYGQAEVTTSKNLMELGKEEAKIRINMLENPSSENIAKNNDDKREKRAFVTPQAHTGRSSIFLT